MLVLANRIYGSLLLGGHLEWCLHEQALRVNPGIEQTDIPHITQEDMFSTSTDIIGSICSFIQLSSWTQNLPPTHTYLQSRTVAIHLEAVERHSSPDERHFLRVTYWSPQMAFHGGRRL